MNLLIFPVICIYFLIGYGLSRLARTEERDDDVGSIAWFMIWPLMIMLFVTAIVTAVICKVCLIVHRLFNKRYAHVS